MAHRRHDLWLLIRLAAQNVGRRRLRAVFLSAAVMLGVGIAFASFVAGWALRDGMATSFSRMGADLVVVPRATLVNITSSLLTVQPTDETLPADLAAAHCRDPRRRTSGAAAHRPRAGRGNAANLIAFDPARDLSVLTWLVERQPGPVEGLIAGGGLAARLGESRQRLRDADAHLRPARQDRRRSVRRLLLPQLRRTGRHGFVLPRVERARCAQTGGKAARRQPPVAGMSHADMSAHPTWRSIVFRPSCCSSRPAPRRMKSSSRSPGFPTSRSSRATP